MGQQQPISGSFKQLRFEQFADSIEQKSSYHFYFNPADVDSFFVDITVDKKTLNEVLQLVFAKTEFHFAIDAKKQRERSRFQIISYEFTAFRYSKKANLKHQDVKRQ